MTEKHEAQGQQPGMSGYLDELADHCTLLENMAAQLESKLGRALTPLTCDPSDPEAGTAKEPLSESAITKAIRLANNRIVIVAGDLQRIISRLEI